MNRHNIHKQQTELIAKSFCVLFSLIFSVLLTACSSHLSTSGETQTPPLSITHIQSKLEYIGPNNIQLDKSSFPEEVILSLPFISGAIFGTPNTQSLYLVPAYSTSELNIDLYEKIDEIKKLIKPLSTEWQQAGLKATPAETRIGRLGSFAYDAENKVNFHAAGFVDKSSRNSLVLIYVDRPCSIMGTFSTGTERFIHDLSFTQAGFHWIEFIREENRQVHIINYKGNNTRFSIQLNELIAI